MRHFVTICFHLVTADDVVKIVALQEPGSDVRAELGADAAFRRRPASHGLRVGPQELAHDAFFWWLPITVDDSDVVEGYVILWEEASVHGLGNRSSNSSTWTL